MFSKYSLPSFSDWRNNYSEVIGTGNPGHFFDGKIDDLDVSASIIRNTFTLKWTGKILINGVGKVCIKGKTKGYDTPEKAYEELSGIMRSVQK